MTRFCSCLCTAGATLLALAWTTARAETFDEYDARITAELAKIDPEAATLFTRGSKALDAGEYALASELFGQVEGKAPTSSHAVRRHCRAEARLGQHEQAVKTCRRALAMERSHENLTALADVLAVESKDPPRSALREARQLLDESLLLAPDDESTQVASCQLSLREQNGAGLRACSSALLRIAPDSVAANLFGAIQALQEGKPGEARYMLLQARAQGLPDGPYEKLSRDIGEADTTWTDHWPTLVGWVAAAWAGLFVILIVLGWILSRLALRAAAQPGSASGKATGLSGSVRQLYAGVLWGASAFYYASIPLMLAVVVLGGGGLIYAMLAAGRVPIKLLAIVAILVVVTLWSVLKGLIVRVQDEDPGLDLDTSEHPRLSAVLTEVAGKVGTRPVDKVFLTPGTEFAVFERGGFLKQLGGRRQRCLLVGAGLLDGFPLPAFKSVLAHEYGHLCNEDTAGGGFALAVRRSLLTMARSLAQGGAAAWYNPMWLFLSGFYRIFLRISQGASRLQEVLADRWAALCYGAHNFEAGLRFVIARSVRFDFQAGASIQEAADGAKPLVNLYRHVPTKQPDEAEVTTAIEAALHREPSPYDSHPAPQQRIAYVHALGAPVPFEISSETAWDLFADREALERRMTAQVRADVSARFGVRLAAGEDDSSP
jgi:Zn-dependent protease with chaperone function